MTHETSRIRDRIRNRALTREQTPIRGRELIGYLTLSALVALPAVFGLWQQNVFVQCRVEIEALRKETLALQERHRHLRIERAALESLSRIAQEARKCGLVPRDETAAPIVVSPPEGPAPAGIARLTDVPAGDRFAAGPAQAAEGALPALAGAGLAFPQEAPPPL